MPQCSKIDFHTRTRANPYPHWSVSIHRNLFGREDPGGFAWIWMLWQILSDKQCGWMWPDLPGCRWKHTVKFIFARITSLYGRNWVHPAASHNDSGWVPVYSTKLCILSNGTPQRKYCRVSIKLTPFHDHDMPDKILVSSPCLEGRDKGKDSSGVTVFWAIPSIFIVNLVVAVSHQGEKLDITRQTWWIQMHTYVLAIL